MDSKNQVQTPSDLLPICRPLESDDRPDNTYFYLNVIQYLIPDIIKIEATGIPINLNRVSEVEDTVTNVLHKVREKLANNSLMYKFLNDCNNKQRHLKESSLDAKKKSSEDFLKPFNPKNKQHRSAVVNRYLTETKRYNMTMEEWSIRDLKKLNEIIASNFINNLLSNKIETFMLSTIDEAMKELAQIKADIYNKNKVESKIESLSKTTFIEEFNPSSPKQKQEFFSSLGIESEKETKSGNPQWDRTELTRLLNLVNVMIDDKEK